MDREEYPEAQRLLERSVDVILERGVMNVSLSQLARAVGSNNRMLLYYFSSKDRLFTEAIRAAYDRYPRLHGLMPGLQEPGPMSDALKHGWRQLRHAENLPYITLFFEALAAAARDPDANPAHLEVLATHWPSQIQSAFVLRGYSADAAATAAVELMALWRGLQFALISGTPVEILDLAQDSAVDALFGDDGVISNS
ncbi:AcrR family transcriptional regulator [Microbacterium endophyticum]|uniref:AcrR family transcriptional regulator n=1 Tax=Microbacterium endophyticum TaxID=1526412 RepID=A0A7W4V382_9MICO|nr:TetR/AcrR family transcriptional regulator [Microbacterium endophyticum]MBB2976035.1 AcrR family transcriptional regulator [Microbacterium endophyticum]NIK35046.1 AcrR family transcriptional regulator [Microbacterium endophyticum]